MKLTIIKHQCQMWANRTGETTVAVVRPNKQVSFTLAGWPILGAIICECKPEVAD
jgi:hypothetical protein